MARHFGAHSCVIGQYCADFGMHGPTYDGRKRAIDVLGLSCNVRKSSLGSYWADLGSIGPSCVLCAADARAFLGHLGPISAFLVSWSFIEMNFAVCHVVMFTLAESRSDS